MKKSFIKILFYEIARMIKAKKALFLFCVTLCVFDALLAFGYIFFIGKLTESLTLLNSSAVKNTVLYVFGIFSLIILLREFSNAILNYYFDKQRMLVTGKLKTDFFNKVASFDVLEFEKPDFLDSLDKAKNGLDGSIDGLINLELIIAQSVVYVLLVAFYMASINPLLLIVVLGAFIPTMFTYVFKNKYKSESEDKSAMYRRQMNKYGSCITDKVFFKESRHLALFNFFIGKFNSSAKLFKKYKTKEIKKLTWIGIITNASQFLGFISIFFVVYCLSKAGSIKAGTIVAVIASVNLLFSHFKELFNYHIAGLADSYTGIKFFHAIMAKETSNKNKTGKMKIKKIRLTDVSFSYPNSEKKALKSVNLEINAGETICIVGKNGSGKSTLSKILLGLYQPASGEIILNESKNASEEAHLLLQKNSSAVFQNFNRYNLSLEENINVADVTKSVKKISQAVEQLSDTLPDKQNTMLSREFGGVDLSMGQWQKLAIERGLFKDASIIIFDEPTSAIDPLLEMDLLNSMLDNKTHSIKIIISHRIGIAARADKILLIDNGEIIESGKHDDLMLKDTEYGKLFKTQQQWYK